MGTELRTVLLLIALLSLCAPPLQAGEVTVAVAANFSEAAQDIATAFQADSGHTALLSAGSSGQLYAQISQAAPFEVFLSADQARPMRAVEEGFAVAGSRFTYAVGKLALWSATVGEDLGADTLVIGDFARLAVANPQTAPYGIAAIQVLEKLGVYDSLAGSLVRGNSIGQTYQFVVTGNAELGFVALSQLTHGDVGSRWVVPENLYEPIFQDAVLLDRGKDNPAARAFVDYLRGATTRAILKRYGYGVAD